MLAMPCCEELMLIQSERTTSMPWSVVLYHELLGPRQMIQVKKYSYGILCRNQTYDLLQGQNCHQYLQ